MSSHGNIASDVGVSEFACDLGFSVWPCPSKDPILSRQSSDRFSLTIPSHSAAGYMYVCIYVGMYYVKYVMCFMIVQITCHTNVL